MRGQHLGFVFQSFHLIESLTAIENVMLPLELNGVGGARKAAEQALHRVGLAPTAALSPPHVGERQRVVARASSPEGDLEILKDINLAPAKW